MRILLGVVVATLVVGVLVVVLSRDSRAPGDSTLEGGPWSVLDSPAEPRSSCEVAPSLESGEESLPHDEGVLETHAQREEVVAEVSAIPTDRTGIVVDENDRPIAGAEVTFIACPEARRQEFLDGDAEDWFATGIQTTATEDGTFPLLFSDPEANHAIVVRKDGYAFIHVVGRLRDLGPLRIVQRPTRELRGIVVDKKGQPVAGAEVFQSRYYVWDVGLSWSAAEMLAMEFVSESTKSGPDGEFVFAQVGVREHSVKVLAPGFAPYNQHHIKQDTRLKTILVPSATVHGIVTDEKGNPLEGILVRTMARGSLPEQSGDWVESDERGVYNIPEAHSGAISLVTWSSRTYASDRVHTWVDPRETLRFDLVMKKEKFLSGVIRMASGGPVGGARLEARCSYSGAVVGMVDSAPDGSFSMRGLNPNHAVNLSIVGTLEYCQLDIEGVQPGVRDLEVIVQPWGKVAGLVRTGGEMPSTMFSRAIYREELSGLCTLDRSARYLSDTLPLRRVAVSSDGSFELKDMPGVYDIEFWVPGFEGVYLENVTIRPGEVNRRIEVDFEPGGEARGLVVNGAGSPVSGASVSLLDQFVSSRWIRGGGCREAKTDDQGRFVLHGLPDRDVAARVFAEGYAPTLVPSIHGATLENPIVLRKSGRIEGEVITDYVDPTSTLKVTVRNVGEEDGLTTSVRQDGTFVIENTPVGLVEVAVVDEYHRAFFSESGPVVRQVAIDEGEGARIVFDAATGVTLRGRVIGGGAGLNLMIQARRVESDGTTMIAGASYTNQAGEFRIPHLRPGTYKIGSSIGRPGSSMGFWKTVMLDATSDDDVIIDIGNSLLEGTVRDHSGDPIARAMIATYAAPGDIEPVAVCLTDFQGEFRIGGIEEGLYDVVARARGYASSISSGYSVPGTSFEIQLAEETILDLEVYDDAGEPVAGASASVLPPRGGRWLAQEAFTGDGGTARFRRLPSGSSTVDVHMDGHVLPESAAILLKPGEPRTIRVELVRFGKARIKVETDLRLPASEILVHLVDEDGNSYPKEEPVATNRKGIAIVEDLAPGFYEVWIADTPIDELEVFPGETSRMTHQLTQ